MKRFGTIVVEEHTCNEIATEVCSGGGASDVADPVTLSARYGTRALYRSMYASSVAECPRPGQLMKFFVDNVTNQAQRSSKLLRIAEWNILRVLQHNVHRY